jgi:hypothetical protein
VKGGKLLNTELCPIPSIFRKLYHDKSHGTTHFPGAVVRIPCSWDQTISFPARVITSSTLDHHVVRMLLHRRNNPSRSGISSFDLLAVLQSTKNTCRPTGPLAYSPEGHSLVCGCSDAIVIWDARGFLRYTKLWTEIWSGRYTISYLGHHL